MKPILSAVGVLVLLLVALGIAAANTAPTSPAFAGDVAMDSTLAAPSDGPVCGNDQGGGSGFAPLALGPHCCATGAASACRDLCKQQGPGCKGAIGCRAGECVCTCTCP